VHWFKNIIIKRELFVKEQIIVQPIFHILALSFVAVANLGLRCRRLSNSQLHEDRSIDQTENTKTKSTCDEVFKEYRVWFTATKEIN
jgi:hypothetical protein